MNGHPSTDMARLELLIRSNHEIVLQRFATVDEKIGRVSEQNVNTVNRLIQHMESEEDDIRDMRREIDSVTIKVKEHIDGVITVKVREHIDGVQDKVLDGFPNKDPKSHREVHEEQIENANVWKVRKEKIITALLEKSSLGILAVIGAALWYYFLYKAGIK